MTSPRSTKHMYLSNRFFGGSRCSRKSTLSKRFTILGYDPTAVDIGNEQKLSVTIPNNHPLQDVVLHVRGHMDRHFDLRMLLHKKKRTKDLRNLLVQKKLCHAPHNDSDSVDTQDFTVDTNQKTDNDTDFSSNTVNMQGFMVGTNQKANNNTDFSPNTVDRQDFTVGTNHKMNNNTDFSPHTVEMQDLTVDTNQKTNNTDISLNTLCEKSFEFYDPADDESCEWQSSITDDINHSVGFELNCERKNGYSLAQHEMPQDADGKAAFQQATPPARESTAGESQLPLMNEEARIIAQNIKLIRKCTEGDMDSIRMVAKGSRYDEIDAISSDVCMEGDILDDRWNEIEGRHETGHETFNSSPVITPPANPPVFAAPAVISPPITSIASAGKTSVSVNPTFVSTKQKLSLDEYQKNKKVKLTAMTEMAQKVFSDNYYVISQIPSNTDEVKPIFSEAEDIFQQSRLHAEDIYQQSRLCADVSKPRMRAKVFPVKPMSESGFAHHEKAARLTWPFPQDANVDLQQKQYLKLIKPDRCTEICTYKVCRMDVATHLVPECMYSLTLRPSQDPATTAPVEKLQGDTNEKSDRPTKPETRGKFHTRTLLMGKQVAPRFIPLEPLWLRKPTNAAGVPTLRPVDPRIPFYMKRAAHLQRAEDKFVDALL